MKIGIIGATGKVGNLVLQEAVNRNHEVTAIIRDRQKLSTSNVNVLERNIKNLSTADLKGLDVVVNAFGAPLGEEQAHVDAGHALIEVMKGTETKLFVVGGAGSLYVDEEKTMQLADTPDFPDAFKPTAKGQARNLAELAGTTNLTWTFLSPSIMFQHDGKRTGAYQAGKDQALVNSEGNSYISYADYAIAVLDELENPKHVNERFTVVGEIK